MCERCWADERKREMVVEYYPWKMEVDIEATKRLYLLRDDSKEKNTNKKIYGLMTDKQKDFFEALGIDILKIDMEEKIHAIPEDGDLPGGRIYVRTLNFLFCGKFLSIPEYQEMIYGDEEMFGRELPETLEIRREPEEDALPVYDIDGLACVFKHPYFRSDEPIFRNWDCGYVLGSILTMKDLDESGFPGKSAGEQRLSRPDENRGITA